MMHRSLAFRILFVLVCIGVLATVGYRWANRVGYRNLHICETLSPGVTAAELGAALGAHREVVRDGETWWYFETPSIEAVQIRAQVNNSMGEVVALYCGEDLPRWRASP
jgi:hypothetical protein